ncbi:hypothetical protein ACFSCZ_09025 [Siminovitchia sediminis]|uniref:Uncharacterized protein n=1 Tax=Siminovitchia sediminis TaxID=1274353 RepID=A0ABW4KJB9_9BACI
MAITEENQLFLREMRRLLTDYERFPSHKKAEIMEDVIILAHALREKHHTSL